MLLIKYENDVVPHSNVFPTSGINARGVTTDFHKLSSVTSPAIQAAHQDADPANVFPSPPGTQCNGDHCFLRRED
jgi:hypothetical protein